MKPRVTLRKVLEDPELLGSALAGPTWHAWRSLSSQRWANPRGLMNSDAVWALRLRFGLQASDPSVASLASISECTRDHSEDRAMWPCLAAQAMQ